jgi:WD40 repeat protein
MDHRLVEWDSGTGSALQELPTRLVGITSLALAADERSLVASGPGGIEVWNVSGKAMAPSLLPHADPVLDLAFGPDGSRLASGSPRRILVWNVDSGHPTVELRREGTRCRDIAYDPKNGRMAATDDHGQIAFWEIPSGRSMGTMGARSTIPFALAYSAQNDLAAVSTNEKTLLVYSLNRRELLHELRGHEADVRGVALAADGKTLYSASFDGTVRAWNLATGSNKILHRRIGRNYGLTLSKDGKTLVVTGLEGVAVAIDLSSKLAKPLGSFPGRLYRPAIAPDGLTVALPSSDGNTYLVDLASGARRALSGHHGEVNTAAFSPDGHLLATGGDDHTVRLFDTVTGKPIWGGGADHVPPSAELPKEPGTTYALRLGAHLVVGFDNGMVEVRPSIETEPRTAVVPLRGTPTQAVTLLAAGPSSTVLVGFADGSFGVWDSEGHLLERVFLHGRVVELAHANGIVTAKSELGDQATIDLGILARDYCPLMSDLYKSLPFVWRDGTVRVEAPKARCTPL